MSSLTLACPDCGKLNRVPVERLEEEPHCGACGSLLFQGQPVELGPHNFQRHVVASELPILIDFWAPWCGPCLAMAPAFAEAARALEPEVRLGKLNTQEQPDLAGQFGIRSIPTLVLVRGGREIARTSGAMPGAQIWQWTRNALQLPTD